MNLLKVLYKNTFKKQFQCAVCGTKLTHYLPLDPSYRAAAVKYGYKFFGQGETVNIEQYYCTFCKASDRDRLYALYFSLIFSALDSSKTYRLLDIAPSAALSKYFFVKFPYIKRRTADLLMENVDDKMDINNMELYLDNSFDFFLCSHVLEHVETPDKSMAELYRVLKNGGKGIIMVPIIPGINETIEDAKHKTEPERIQHYGQGDHLRLFGKKDFIKRLEYAGFLVSQLGVSFFGIEAFTLNGIKKTSILYVVEKAND